MLLLTFKSQLPVTVTAECKKLGKALQYIYVMFIFRK